MATVKQLTDLEKRLENEAVALYELMRTEPAQRSAWESKAEARWHAHKLSQAREYRFRLEHTRHEGPHELSTDETTVTHTYEPHQRDAGQPWTELDGDNVEFFRKHDVPQRWPECVAQGDTDSDVALYLKARDLILDPGQVPVALQPPDERVWQVIVEQVENQEATLWQYDLYALAVVFTDDPRFVLTANLAYSDELGLYDEDERPF